MSNTTPQTQEQKNLADKLTLARASGSWAAWAELLRRFDYKQRQHLANLLAHDWSIKELVLESRYGSDDTIKANVSLDKVVFPQRGKEDPALAALQEDEKTYAALLADNHRLRTSAQVAEQHLKNFEEDVTQFLASLVQLAAQPEDNRCEMLEKINNFKTNY